MADLRRVLPIAIVSYLSIVGGVYFAATTGSFIAAGIALLGAGIVLPLTILLATHP